ncbi:MAG: MFS transporter [Candidatus Bathyarchaeia archaeon]
MSPTDRNLFALCLAGVIAMLGVGVVGPILPIYALSFGVSYTATGTIISAFGVARLFTEAPVGWLADRLGKKRIIVLGIGVMSLSAFIAAFAGDVFQLVLARLVQGVGAALYATTATALVADIAPLDRRGAYMSYFQGSFFMGIAFGPAVGGIAAEVAGIRAPFLLWGVLAAVSAVFAKSMVGDSPSGHWGGSDETDVREHSRASMFDRVLIPSYLAGLTTLLISSGLRFTLIPIYGKHIGLTLGQVGAVLTVAAATNVAVMPLSGRLIDKFGVRPSLLYGFLLYALAVYSFTWSDDFLKMVVSGLLLGLTTAMVYPAQATNIAAEVTTARRGLAFGVYRSFCDVGLIVGPLVVGLLIDASGFVAPLMLMSCLSLIVGTCVLLLFR